LEIEIPLPPSISGHTSRPESIRGLREITDPSPDAGPRFDDRGVGRSRHSLRRPGGRRAPYCQTDDM
jgi:hypothetical protein